MASIRAVVVDPEATGRLSVKEVDEPQPSPHEALVCVHAISLNRGELLRAQTSPPGSRIGWDFAGTVETAAAEGVGPPVGAPVVGFLPTGAWAERVAVPTQSLAVLPEGVSFAQAAALPVAGLTALYALQKGGTLLGRKVLIAGASGGVGHLAVQLARQAGATVVGLVRRSDHIELVKKLGAHEVVVDETGAEAAELGPYDLALDSVGGSVLATALTSLTKGGTCVHFGTSASRTVTFDSAVFFRTGRATLYGFYIFTEVGAQPAGEGLATLAALVSDGRLRPCIEVEAPWTRIGEIAEQLMERQYVGKAVLTVV